MLISVEFLSCPPSPPFSSSIMDTSASDSPHRDMATTLVLPHSQPHLQNGSGVNRRYRPAPAKTFQCRGYGDCRMVFSRSEHLARHIRSVFLALSSLRPSSVPDSLIILSTGSTPANVLSPAIVESSSLVSTICANMPRQCMPTSRTPTSV
jgi:hypothetical protein